MLTGGLRAHSAHMGKLPLPEPFRVHGVLSVERHLHASRRVPGIPKPLFGRVAAGPSLICMCAANRVKRAPQTN